MRYKIVGNNLQLVICEIQPGEQLYAEAGSMNHMSANMQMTAQARGGIMKGIGRKLAGESFFVTNFAPMGGPGFAAFGGNVPGTIKPIELTGGRIFMCQKDAFLVAQNTVEMDIAFQRKLGAGFFGGEGFILQKLTGQGTAFIHACGDFVEMDLAPGQTVKVDTGSVVGWDGTVRFDIQRAGGIKTSLFAGEGLFLTTLTGPGHVILQSMTLKNLAMAIYPFLPQQSSGNQGGIVGNLLSG
ncbi:MAG: TIGR00266 family protein [Candidatus Thermoplasmatota archaeon]|nr:TIGR00266 family protein [Candidatus Thermoplasmatota archaeon]